MTAADAAVRRTYGGYGGRYVPETLTRALDELAAEMLKESKIEVVTV